MDVFDIRVLGFEDWQNDPVTELARVFDIGTHTAEKIVRRAPVVVKRDIDQATAERFLGHLHGIGARVRIEKRVVPSTPPPEAPAPPAPAEAPILPPPAAGFGVDLDSGPGIGAGAGFGAGPGFGDGFDSLDSMDSESLPVPDFEAVGIDPTAPESRPPSLGPEPMGSVPPAPADAPPSDDQPSQPAPPGGGTVPRDRVAPVTAPQEEGEVHAPFIPRLLGAFLYPFQQSALAIFVGIAVVSAVLSIVPFVGGFLAAGVQAVFFFQVIQHTGDGADDFPAPADFTELADLIGPSVRFILAILVPFVPAVLATYVIGFDSPAVIPVAAVLILAGLAYMPASVMVASLTGGCLGPLNPVAGVMMIMRVPSAYAITAFCVGGTMVVHGMVMGVVLTMTELIPLPFIPGLIHSSVSLVLPTVASRMLGIFLHQNRHELGLGFE